MKIGSRAYFFILTPRTSDTEKTCIQCNGIIKFGSYVFSKRGRRYYCSSCAVRLGLVKKPKEVVAV